MPKTQNISLRLIKLIKRFPELYNSQHDLANDKAHSMVVWDTISYELDAPVKILKKKWQKLRSSHRKKCGSLKTAKSATSYPRDDLFDIMNSMLETSDVNFPSDEDDDSSGCSGPTFSVISEEGRSTRSSNSGSTVLTEVTNAAKPLRKLPEVEKIGSNRVLRSHKRATRSEGLVSQTTKINCDSISSRTSKKSEKRNDEPVKAFFQSMALTVAKFPQRLQAETKTKICDIVFEAELELSPPMIR